MIAARGLPLVALAALTAGCTTRELNVDVPGSGGAGVITVDGGEFTPTRAVDILFVIDDSSYTRRMQDNLLRNFPSFVTRLLDPPGLPSLHLAVISTDLGAGDGSVAGCDAIGGKNGIFQYNARGTCTMSGLDPGATFISDINGARNYSGNLQDVFSCIAALGESGCGFEHQLAAITRALGADGKPAPAENQGFLRPDAFLVILVITDEDDCSAPPDSPLFDTVNNTSLESSLGPPGNFRCNEFGHLCDGAPPPRLPPSGSSNDVVTLEKCVPAEEQGMLIPVRTIAAQLRSLKRFPDRQIVVGAITGPITPYTVRWVDRPGDSVGARPHIAASCTSADTTSAAPAVRIQKWAEAFGQNGMVMPVCADNFGAALDKIAELMNGALPVITP